MRDLKTFSLECNLSTIILQSISNLTFVYIAHISCKRKGQQQTLSFSLLHFQARLSVSKFLWLSRTFHSHLANTCSSLLCFCSYGRLKYTLHFSQGFLHDLFALFQPWRNSSPLLIMTFSLGTSLFSQVLYIITPSYASITTWPYFVDLLATLKAC